MEIPIILEPGTFLKSTGTDDVFLLGVLVDEGKRALLDAALSLHFFKQQQAEDRVRRSLDFDKEEHLRRRHALSALENELYGPEPDVFLYKDRNELRKLMEERRNGAAIEMLKRRADVGELPRQMTDHVVFLHAENFVIHGARLRRILRASGEYSSAEAASKLAVQVLDSGLPDLRSVRDSIEHREDRAQGKAKDKTITSSSVNIPGFIKTAGGGMIGLSLQNETLWCTLANGTMGQIAISSLSLEVLTKATQTLISGLAWEGSPSVWPSVY